MKIIRRELLYLAGVAAALPSTSKIAWAQTQVAPKLTPPEQRPSLWDRSEMLV
jgi:hypothetical protein